MTLRSDIDFTNCPANLRALVEQEDGVKFAAKKIGVHKTTMSAYVSGRTKLSPTVNARIDAALTTAAAPIPKQPAIPDVQPWDGKRASAQVFGSGAKKKTLKNIPEPLAKLIDRHEGNRTRTAASLGVAPATVQAILDGEKEYSDKWHARVMAALSGQPLPSQQSSEQFDRYTLGLAIVIVTLGQFERVLEIAEILGGNMIFKKGTKIGWLVIFRMAHRDKCEKFKRLARRDAQEIVCP